MAGETERFQQFTTDLGNKIHDLDGDTLKAGFITSVVTPTAPDPAPHFGGAGTTNFATNEVTPGGNYPAGGVTLTSVAYALSANTAVGATTDAAGYAIGATSITIGAGTGAITEGETILFPGDSSRYVVKTGVADISLGGVIVIHKGLNKAIPSATTAISQAPTSQLKSAKISIAQNASNPTNARWLILYNNTDANKRCIAFIDLGTEKDLTTGLFEFKFNFVDGVGTVLTV